MFLYVIQSNRFEHKGIVSKLALLSLTLNDPIPDKKKKLT